MVATRSRLPLRRPWPSGHRSRASGAPSRSVPASPRPRVRSGGAWPSGRRSHLGVDATRAGPRASPLTLAVLPFTNLSGDPAREYLAEGLAEETATSLGQIDPEQMGVVARSSTMRYKGTTKSAAEIGRELAADYLVESSLRDRGHPVARDVHARARARPGAGVVPVLRPRADEPAGPATRVEHRHRRADPSPPLARPSRDTGASTDTEPRRV